MSKNETLFHYSQKLHKMRVESPFFEKSPARLILTRARRLGILTFDKIKKTEQTYKIRYFEAKTPKVHIISSKSNITQKNDVKKFFMGRILPLFKHSQ